jgi:hypothetical protein
MKALLKLEVLLGDKTNFFSATNFIIIKTLACIQIWIQQKAWIQIHNTANSTWLWTFIGLKEDSAASIGTEV